MPEEVGRWRCEKCGGSIVVIGERAPATFRGTGAFTGSCPWECGGWINRGFRRVRPGGLRVFRAEEWDARGASAGA